jgi:hypothetical protein
VPGLLAATTISNSLTLDRFWQKTLAWIKRFLSKFGTSDFQAIGVILFDTVKRADLPPRAQVLPFSLASWGAGGYKRCAFEMAANYDFWSMDQLICWMIPIHSILSQ